MLHKNIIVIVPVIFIIIYITFSASVILELSSTQHPRGSVSAWIVPSHNGTTTHDAPEISQINNSYVQLNLRICLVIGARNSMAGPYLGTFLFFVCPDLGTFLFYLLLTIL